MNSKKIKKDLVKIPRLILGFLLISFGIYLIKKINMGMNAWGTFQLGITNITSLAYGTINILVGLVIIIISTFFKFYPGIGTILNMILVGSFINLFDKFIVFSNPDSYFLKIFILLIGLIIYSYGVFMYLSCNMGAGPRDGLMVTLVKLTNKSVFKIRTGIEITVFAFGFILGAKIGLGTVIVTLCGGWILNQIFEFHNYDTEKSRHSYLGDYLNKKASANNEV